MTKKVNFLTHIQAHRLYNWMAENVHRFERKSYNEVSELATQELEFSISPYSIKSARAELGLEWTFKDQEIVNARERAKDLKNMKSQLRSQEERLDYLDKWILLIHELALTEEQKNNVRESMHRFVVDKNLFQEERNAKESSAVWY